MTTTKSAGLAVDPAAPTTLFVSIHEIEVLAEPKQSMIAIDTMLIESATVARSGAKAYGVFFDSGTTLMPNDPVQLSKLGRARVANNLQLLLDRWRDRNNRLSLDEMPDRFRKVLDRAPHRPSEPAPRP